MGISFAPTSDEQRKKTVGSPLQQAIQVLSLRVPKVVGAWAPIPQGLLPGSGGGGSLGNSVVQSVLASLLGAQGGQAAGQAAATGPIAPTAAALAPTPAGTPANPVAQAVQRYGGSAPTPQAPTPQAPRSLPPQVPTPQVPPPIFTPGIEPSAEPGQPPRAPTPPAPAYPSGVAPIPGGFVPSAPRVWSQEALADIFGQSPEAPSQAPVPEWFSPLLSKFYR